MKKILILFSAASLIMSCGNDNADASTTTNDAATTTPGAATEAPSAAANADADKGLDLIAKSDCLTCHKVEEKLVGPAYREVANKYPNDAASIDMLASKIISGGAGNWGQIAMTPHADLSKEDAQTMVKYILSLKQ